MKKLAAIALLLLSACQRSGYVEGDDLADEARSPGDCARRCQADNLTMSGFVYIDSDRTACVCQVGARVPKTALWGAVAALDQAIADDEAAAAAAAAQQNRQTYSP